MAISVSGSCRCATRLMAVGALLFGIATATQAERYETVTREDGSIEVRRVEFPEAAPAAETPMPEASDDGNGPAVEAETALGVPSGNGQRFEPDESYIDAAELEKAGFQRDGRQKFYTYIDETGQFRSRPYQEAGQAEAAVTPENAGQQIMAEEQWLVPPDLPDVADADASRILGLNQAQAERDIDRLASACCSNLLDYMRELEYPVDEMDSDDGIVLNIEAEEADYGFATGRSRFRVISLETLETERRVRLRAFVNANRADLFYPAVMTLDKDWKPIRLFNNIVYSYESESWFRRAYLEGFIELDPAKEAYAVVLSRQRDQSRKSVVYPDEYGPEVLDHARHGTVQLSPLGP